jgi:hypothetical protein
VPLHNHSAIPTTPEVDAIVSQIVPSAQLPQKSFNILSRQMSPSPIRLLNIKENFSLLSPVIDFNALVYEPAVDNL